MVERLPVEQEVAGPIPVYHPKMYFIYILQSQSTNKYYIGSTSNLVNRLNIHNSNRSLYTKNKGPYKIIYTEEFLSRSEAVKREKQIKSYKGGNAFKRLLQR